MTNVPTLVVVTAADVVLSPAAVVLLGVVEAAGLCALVAVVLVVAVVLALALKVVVTSTKRLSALVVLVAVAVA